MEYVRAFVIGGTICVIGQLLIDLTKLTPARIMVAYVTGGVLLGALGWYAPLVNFAGCGATVPLSGFGYLLSEGVKAAVKEKGILGVFTGGITAGARRHCRSRLLQLPDGRHRKAERKTVKNKRRRERKLCGACSWFEKGILSDSTHPFFILFVHPASLKPDEDKLIFCAPDPFYFALNTRFKR